jgi:hypothetical protein
MEPHEYDDFGIPDLPEAAKRHGLDVIALAIPDAGIPSSTSDVADLVRDKMRRECRNASRRSRRVRKWRRDAPLIPQACPTGALIADFGQHRLPARTTRWAVPPAGLPAARARARADSGRRPYHARIRARRAATSTVCPVLRADCALTCTWW